MDIHKPKHWHGVREFLKEYVIIVVGVLTALGAEQSVDWLHRASEVREAREALRNEIRGNLATAAKGLEEDTCLLKQLPAYAAWARGGAKPQPYRSVLKEYDTSTFETVKGSAVPHMPLQERLAVARFYDELAAAEKIVEVQRARGQVLFGIYEQEVLGGSEASRLLDSVAVDRQLTRIHMAVANGLFRRARDLGVEPPKPTAEDRQDVVWLCTGAGADPFTPRG